MAGKVELVVTYSSAVPESLPNAGKAGIHASHSEMCKFKDAGAAGWNVLAGVLKEAAEDAGKVVADNWITEDKRQQVELERSIQRSIQGRFKFLVSAGRGGAEAVAGYKNNRRSPSPHMGSDGWGGSRLDGMPEQGLLTGPDDCIQPHEIYEPDGSTLTRKDSFGGFEP